MRRARRWASQGNLIFRLGSKGRFHFERNFRARIPILSTFLLLASHVSKMASGRFSLRSRIPILSTHEKTFFIEFWRIEQNRGQIKLPLS